MPLGKYLTSFYKHASWDFKNKTQPFLDLSLPQGVPLGLQLDLMTDLTNETLHIYIIAIVYLFYKSGWF